MRLFERRNPFRACPSCSTRLTVLENGSCSDCGHQIAPQGERRVANPPFLSLPPMRYQNQYVWLVFLSALDIFLTILVLYVWKGHEVNPLAATIIKHMGFRWTIVFKFALIMLVIVICEVVGRVNDRKGWSLALAAIVIGAIPVAYTFGLLFKAGPPTPEL